MNVAWFRFYEELNDFLPSSRKKQLFSYSFTGNPSIKDLVESLGVPHVEVDMILVNGKSVDFTFKIKNEDHVSVYPVFEVLDISDIQHLREKPLRDMKFILDVHLGRLAKYLRLAGFDTLYKRDFNDLEIISLSLSEKRVILTRDKGLLKNRLVTHGYWVRSINPGMQFRELVEKFSLKSSFTPFTRCIECNTPVIDVPKSKISDRLLPKTRKYFDLFKICPDCKRIYWEGSHFEKMQKSIKAILEN